MAVRSFMYLNITYYLTRPSFFYDSVREDQTRWQQKVDFVKRILVFEVPVRLGASIVQTPSKGALEWAWYR